MADFEKTPGRFGDHWGDVPDDVHPVPTTGDVPSTDPMAPQVSLASPSPLGSPVAQPYPVASAGFAGQPPTYPMAPTAPPATVKIFLPTSLKDAPRFFQAPARAWWWGLIGVVVLAALTFLSMLIFNIAMVVTDPVFATAALRGEEITTPLVFLWNNIWVASLIPIAVFVSWAFYRQGFGWLVSVTGRARWRWFGLAVGVFALGYVVYYGVSMAVFGVSDMGWDQFSWQPTSLFLIVAVLVTTPFQCAGEEFLFRGALSRLIGGIFPFKWVGLVAAAILSSAAFMWLHSAGDPWLNLNYFSVGLMMWWLAYRTGGLEASIAFHMINNLFAEISLPFTDISGMFDRSAGSASASVLISLGFQVIMVVIIDILARRRGLVRQSSPSALTPQVVRPKRWFTPVGAVVTDATVADLPRLATTVRESPAPIQLPTWGYADLAYPPQAQGAPAWVAPARGYGPAGGYGPAPTMPASVPPVQSPWVTPSSDPLPIAAPVQAPWPPQAPSPSSAQPWPVPSSSAQPWSAPSSVPPEGATADPPNPSGPITGYSSVPGSIPPWATPTAYPSSTDGTSQPADPAPPSWLRG